MRGTELHGSSVKERGRYLGNGQLCAHAPVNRLVHPWIEAPEPMATVEVTSQTCKPPHALGRKMRVTLRFTPAWTLRSMLHCA